MEEIILGKASRKLAKKQQKKKNGEQQKKISEIKIGVYPAGSGNDFARNIEDSSLKKLKQNIINH